MAFSPESAGPDDIFLFFVLNSIFPNLPENGIRAHHIPGSGLWEVERSLLSGRAEKWRKGVGQQPRKPLSRDDLKRGGSVWLKQAGTVSSIKESESEAVPAALRIQDRPLLRFSCSLRLHADGRGLSWRKSPHPGRRQPEHSERADSAGTPLPGIVQSIASWFRAIRIHCPKSIQQTTPIHDRIFVTQAERSFLWLPHQYFGEKSIFIYFVTAYN